ncbi:MAG TPA: hypothetical protein VIW03_04015 [Anaeromyxobacter sp.]
MRNLLLSLVLGSFLAPRLAVAQAAVDIRIGFPAPPPLVVVSPGVRVVPEYHEEVFFVDGWYWARRDAVWYRTRDHRGGWVVASPRYVPAAIVRLPPGKYKHWRKAEEKAERRAWKAERKEAKEREKAERREWKDEERGHGKGKHHRD